MALLNVATSYSDVSSKLSLTSSTTGDYIKLYFTKDGHIITHGVDYTPWSYNSSGNRYWDIKYLPVDNTVADDKHLWDSKTIENKIAQSFIANDAMRFKGTLGLVSGSTTKYTIDGNEASFPSSPQVGDTYRIVTAGTYAGQKCEIGDLLICVTGGDSTTWTVVQTNINGYVTNTINNVKRTTYSNDSEGYTIYAPTSSGTASQILISKGNNEAPVWQTPSNITVGTANKVIGTLSTKNSGLQMSASYNGSSNVTISLVAATTSSLGGVQIDNSTNPTISVSNGKIYLTAANIKNALGYDPVGVNSWRSVKVNGTEVLTSATTTDPLNLANGAGIIVTNDTTNKKITFSVNTSYTTTNNNYKVQVDSNSGGLYVNVPQTTYGVVSSTANGLAPKVISSNTALISSGYYILASSNGSATPSWYKLPTTAFQNTWRDIKVGGTSINSKSLNFMPTGDIYVKIADQNTTTENEFDIGFGLSWYNISTNEYEYE